MHGGLLVAHTLASQGVQTLFTLCGGHIAPILLGCKHCGIRVIDTRHEVNAVFAADAVARLTGIPGVAAVTAGPGVTNTITAIKNAQMAQSPLILLGGATATVLKGRGSLQDIDQMALIKPHVKIATSIKRVRDIPSVLLEAFRIALSGVPGPVFVELPIDTLYPRELIAEWYGVNKHEESTKPAPALDHKTLDRKTLDQRMIQWYLGNHLNAMFRGDLEELAAHAAAAERVVGDVKTIPPSGAEQVAAVLRRAERPVMVIGSQALLDAPRADKLRSAVEAIGIPVYLSGMARGLLGAGGKDDASLQMRHKRKEALKEADVVLLAGVPCDFRLDYGNHISRRATLISVNRSEEDLYKNRTPDIALHGDPMDFLIALSHAIKLDAERLAEQFSERLTEHFATLRKRDAERNMSIAQQARESFTGDGEPLKDEFLNPLRTCQTLDEQFAPESILVADGGDFVATASYIVRPRGPLTWYDPGVFGTLGVGAGFALGVKAVKPDAEVWILYGDGSVGYSLAEFDTFARHKMGVIAVVGNDAGWTQIAREQIPLLGDAIGTVLARTDYHVAARGLGGDGAVVRSPDELAAALEQAKRAARAGTPFLVNALIGTSEFRKGSISM
jgi:acetolactate synthase-1/2/3 large subunit